MQTPVRAYAQLVRRPALHDTQPQAGGWCVDRYFVDARDLPDERSDPAEPPAGSAAYWADAVTSDLLLVPELRGAILSPRRVMLHADESIHPCVSPLQGYGLHDWWSATRPTEPWMLKTHQDSGARIALFAPADASARGSVRTTGVQPKAGSFLWLYRTFAPPAGTDGWTDTPAGVWIHSGCQPGRLPFLSLWLPQPHPSDDSTNQWAVCSWTRDEGGDPLAVWLDKRPQPRSRSHEGALDVATDWVMVLNVVGRLVVQHSRLEGAWVYAPAGGVSLRQGACAFEIYGSRGWAQFGRVEFPARCVVRSPVASYGNWIAKPAEMRVDALASRIADPLVGDATYAVTYEVVEEAAETFRARHTVTVTNRSDGRRTPLLFRIQEIHRARLSSDTGADEDLTSLLRRVRVSHEAKGRGATATAALRNWEPPELGSGAYTLGGLDELRGIDRWTLALGHQSPEGKEALVPQLVGYTTGLRRNRRGLWPEVTVELQDRTCLWEDGKATMLFVPDLSGMDFREAMLLLLNLKEVPEDEVVFPDNYADHAMALPRQELSAAAKFREDTGLIEALDRLAALCWMKWRIRPDGRVEFRWSPAPAPAPSFVLSESTVMPRDRILAAATASDYRHVRTVSYTRGRDEWGADLEALFNAGAAYLIDESSPQFVGRRLYTATVEPDNKAPGTMAQRRLFETRDLAIRLEWQTIGRDLWLDDVVEVQVPHLGVPLGTRFVIRSKTSEAAAGLRPGDLRWHDSYTGDIVTGATYV